MNFSLPPTIILMSQDGQCVTLGEAQFFGDSCLVHVQSPCCITQLAVDLYILKVEQETYQDAEWVAPL
jgi:hypothetical protein